MTEPSPRSPRTPRASRFGEGVLESATTESPADGYAWKALMHFLIPGVVTLAYAAYRLYFDQ